MKLARTIRLDASDENIFEQPAQADEWAISGAFEFSNWSDVDLTGKRKQAFVNGWMGLESFGRATLVAVAQVSEFECEALNAALADHFVAVYGAPDRDAALPVAAEELRFMRELCDEHEPNTLLAVERTLTDMGVKESFRAIKLQDAPLEAIAVHLDEG